ncbi:60S ribosomal protein L10 [Microtus ochrogaster]|uniref:60S ribosomal protein L10 n=1 Tax=Microtus ochrogaster TaxID=79684 RepID=A0A8J6KUJ5_MICOH|nr:60S ribosomal protein L10 [Microtus ochrogaster]
MCGSFGKPQGIVVRLHTGQVTIFVCTKLQNKEHVIEALPRAKFKFPGHPKTHLSKKWAFTKFNADEFEDMVTEKRLAPDGMGPDISPILVPWMRGGPCIPEVFHGVLLFPTKSCSVKSLDLL